MFGFCVAAGLPPLRGFPLGLGGFLAGKEKPMSLKPEEMVKDIQDMVVREMDGRSELYRQAVYQYLYGIGHRIPTGSPHANLLRIAKQS